MRLPKVVFALALAPLALAFSSALPASQTSAAPAKPVVLHLVEHEVHDVEINVGNAVDDKYVGDQTIFANTVYTADNKQLAGHDQGICTRTVVGKAWECTFTLFLKGGQLTIEGPYYDNADSDLAITGGTGTYVQTRGQLHMHARNVKGTEYDYVLTLYPA